MRCLQELLMLLADMLHLGLLSSTSLLGANPLVQRAAVTTTATTRMLLAAVTDDTAPSLTPFGHAWPTGESLLPASHWR